MARENAHTEIKAFKSELQNLKWTIVVAIGLFTVIIGIIALVIDK